MRHLTDRERLTDDVRLKSHLSLPVALRTARVHKDIHHEFSAVPPHSLFEKCPRIFHPSDLPQPCRNDAAGTRRILLLFLSDAKRTHQLSTQLFHAPFYHIFIVAVHHPVLLTMAFCVDILCIAENRIFQDSVCKIQTAVCVCTAAEPFTDAFLLPGAQI